MVRTPLNGNRLTKARSWMFMPGNKQRFLDKAPSLGMDVVIFDLEDGVPVAEKEAARKNISACLAAGKVTAGRYVRVNEVGSKWFRADLNSVLMFGLDGLCLPKVEDASTIVGVARRLQEWEQEAGLAEGSIRLVAAIESARGLQNASAIASASSRLEGLLLGSEDLALDLGLPPHRVAEASELLYARSALVVAARSAGLRALDGVYPDYADIDGLIRDAVQARRLGFSGKSLFHPGQIEDINRIFTPSPAEVEQARTIVDAFETAEQRGDGAVAVGGQLIDLPIVLRARMLLETSNLVGSGQTESGTVR
jgi:citrate lyase subunit beta / citryl-CoA lyase